MISIRSLIASLAFGVIACTATPAPDQTEPAPSVTSVPTVDDEATPQALCPKVWVCSNGTRYSSGPACAAGCPGGSANCDIGCVFTGPCICPL